MTDLIAPFPWFGGKRKVAAEVWRRLGDTPNYIEPFFGSGAILLGRPEFDGNRIETINDADGHLANFWRSLQADPDGVARYAAWPVNELDLHARGDWLFYRPDVKEWVERLRSDPDYYDAKSAGWWVWFVSSWIGRLPSIEVSQIKGWRERIQANSDRTGMVSRQLPHLGDTGKGVNRASLGSTDRREHLTAYLRQLAARLERVRVCYGDWSRVTGPSVTYKHGLTAVFLDPPYSAEAGRDNGLYSTESLTVAHDAREWAIANGDNPLMRIALCGYDGEGHEELSEHGWSSYAWKAPGGYGSQGNGRGKDNAKREVIWFSPHCLNPDAEKEWRLFDEVTP